MTENKPIETCDSKIMIDGVDVSGCEDYGYRGSAGYWCHNYDEPCTDYPNCNFKQLARKTQECELNKLKIVQLQEVLRQYETDLSTKDCIVETCKAQYNQLKAENERLQKTQFCFAYEKDCHKVCKQQNCIIKNGYKAEQKLNKIKDRCNETLELMNKDSGTNAYAGGRCIEAENILQIIDEVE